VFLGSRHEHNERKTWSVIALCGVMMIVEIVGGAWFGSLALIADGLHMTTHAGAMLIAALAYTYARRHAHDPRFVFGTGKLGDLAGYTSALLLAIIAAFVGYEAVMRLLAPIPIRFAEAIPIAVLGLIVNVVSAWLLSDPEHDHGLHGDHHRADPHDTHGSTEAHRDHNIRSAYVHVLADAAVSVLAIVGLSLGWIFGWLWMDPCAGILGALVIASWAYRLVRDTAAILLDMNPDPPLAARIRAAVEHDGDQLIDLHLWRLGPGHLGAVLAVLPRQARDCAYYRAQLSQFKSLSHLTIEVVSPG
jgi:cation diffusion facilitator family transporter